MGQAERMVRRHPLCGNRRQDCHGYTRGACELALVIDYLDLPHMSCTPKMDGLRHAGYPALARASDMVCIDI